jgi:hypothetical protein
LQQIRHLKEHVGQDEVVIQEDFAENISIKHQNEVHWVSEGVTILTAIITFTVAS